MTHRLVPTTVAPGSQARTLPAHSVQIENPQEAAVPSPDGAGLVADYIADRFHALVLQPATLCNLDCAYCYLPDRKTNRLMPVEVAQACARSIADQNTPQAVDVIWHGGEPTATPLNRMRSLLAPFEHMRRAGLVQHVIQTNATLIDQRWCDLFREFGFEVGVSVDGPAAANQHRVDWRGRSTWERIMRGIDALRKRGIEFTVICVVSPDTIDDPDTLLDFFSTLGCSSVGFNLEEEEGTGRPPLDETAAYWFWRRLWRYRAAGNPLPVRDMDRFTSYVAAAREGQHRQRRFDPIPTVAWDGHTVLLSPELLGITSADYGDFLAGNVLDTTIPTMLATASTLRYVREFATALDSCARTCPLWDSCGGAQAGNRFFETGHFTVSETRYCRTTKKSLVRAAADHIRSGKEVHP